MTAPATEQSTAPTEAMKAKRVTASQLTKWDTLRREATELDRTAKAKRAEATTIERLAMADLKASGKPTITRGGWRLSWIDARMSVSWKDAFLEKCGATAAAELIKNLVPKKKLQITPPAEQ